MLLHDVGEDYWSISYYFFYCINLFPCERGLLDVFFFDAPMTRYGRRLFICWYFFFLRQTWLRGTHAAPTIEGYWLTKQHGRHISFFIWNFQIWEMTIDRQRSCNSFDVYAMTRYGGGLLVNIFSIIYFFTCTTWRLFIDIVFYRVKLGSVARMLPLR